MATIPSTLQRATIGPQQPGSTRDHPQPSAPDRLQPADGPAPSEGQKLLDGFLELRNRLVQVETGFLEQMAAIRGVKQGEIPPPQARAQRTETNFVAGAAAVMADMDQSIRTMENGLAELKRLF